MDPDNLPDPPAELHSDLNPIVKRIGEYQDKLAGGHRFTRDDVAQLRAMVKAIPDIREIARDLGGDHDLAAGAMYLSELPRVVYAVMEQAGIDTTPLHAADTDEQYVTALSACFDRLEAKSMVGPAGGPDRQRSRADDSFARALRKSIVSESGSERGGVARPKRGAANAEVLAYIRRTGADDLSVRSIAEAIGRSPSTVGDTPAWKAYAARKEQVAETMRRNLQGNDDAFFADRQDD